MAQSILDRVSIKSAYQKLSKLPLGSRIFSHLFGWIVPYTGSISPRVEKVERGFARIRMEDHRYIRNHLNSVHAAALMNLGEAASGLALNYDLPENSKAILKEMKMEYLKKARGRLHAEGFCEVPKCNSKAECVSTAHIFDESNTIVAKATAVWLISPKS